MKKISTLLCVLLATVFTATAQDPSNWTKGQDVTSELAWSDYSGQTNDGAWQTAGGAAYAYDFQEWEMYEGDNHEGAEFYQIFYLPAGVYTFKVQGFFRGNYQTPYWDGTENIGAVFFAESVTLDDNGDVSEVTRSQESELSSIASSEYSKGRLFTTTEWTNDVEYTAPNGTKYYVPNCMEGTRVWFDEGYYDTNSLRVIQLEDGYIKLGIRKTMSLSGSWVIFSNFRATYDNDASEGVQLLIAQEDFYNAFTDAESLQDKLLAYPALYAYCSDDMMELNDKYENVGTLEGYQQGAAEAKELIAKYKKYYQDALTLSKLIVLSEGTISGTDYAGKSEFQSAINAAKEVEADGNTEDFVTNSAEDYTTAMTTLATARANYAISKGLQADGSYDFSSIVAYPFFCNMEYNPTLVDGTWTYPDVVINGDGTLTGWSDVGESSDNGGDNSTTATTTRVCIASEVSIGSDTTSVYSWYQTGTTGYVPYWNHKMSSAKQWATPGNRREIVQNLVGLPIGYYSVKGRGITWNNDWSATGDNAANLGIYIQSSSEKASSTEEVYKSGWWGYDYNDWTDFTTGMVFISDGKARVAFHANGFSSFTGMQLVYYGEEPDFTLMVNNQIAEVNTNAENLILNGDKQKVADIISEIPTPVTGYDAYADALSKINEANEYINAAITYLNANDPTAMYTELAATYAEDDAIGAAIETATNKTFEVYEGETSTYKDVESLVTDYAAYEHYFETITNYRSATDNAEVSALIDSQLEELKESYADSEKITEYERALAVVYNQAILSDLGMDKASESNPVDITSLIVNPTFAEGSKGWTGDITVDGTLENAERYSTNFNIYQTIYSLPAGAYEVEVQSFYRDGYMESAFNHSWYEEDGGYQDNVKFYANDKEVSIVSIANSDAIFTDRSFTEYTFETDDVNGEGETVTLKGWMEETSETDDEGNVTYTVTSYKQAYDTDGNLTTVDAGEAWIYDAWVVDGTDRYFFPNSMRGTAARFNNDNGAYINKIQIMLDEETNDLTIGLKKDVTINGDWCLFDNFKLYYLGKDIPTGINNVENAATKEIYTIDGRRVQTMQKGINIVKSSNGTVKKVLVK